MVTSKAFENILDQIRSSNLNFQLHLSPFAAQILVKKSLVKEKSGFLLSPPTATPNLPKPFQSDILDLTRRNLHLERSLENLQKNYEDAVLDSENAHSVLEKQLEVTRKAEIKKETTYDLEDELREKSNIIESLAKDNRKLKKENYEKSSGLADVKASLQTKTLVSNKLNKELNDNKESAQKEKTALIKDFKVQIKSLKEDLGDEKRENLLLKRNLIFLRRKVKSKEVMKSNQRILKLN
jgi:predicted RNase H-like nuclease (RuvC/YqgF family)